MKALRLYVEFALAVLQCQYGITRELAAQRLLEAAEALARCGDQQPSEAEVLALALDLHALKLTSGAVPASAGSRAAPIGAPSRV